MVAKGKIVWVSGPAVKADGMSDAKMYETVSVGNLNLIGEVIRLTGDVAFSQVYETKKGMTKKYKFTPTVKVGDKIQGGDVLSTVDETQLIKHSILVPPDHPDSKLTSIVSEGEYDLETEIAVTESDGKKIPLKMYHR